MYDPNKDVVTAAFPSVKAGPDTRLEFEITRYDGGVPKLRITRVRRLGGEERRGAMGRLTFAEVSLVAHKLREVMTHKAWGPGALPKGGADGPF